MKTATKTSVKQKNGHKIIVPQGESMSRILGKVIKQFRIGDKVEVWFKDNKYIWQKTSATNWTKIKSNPVTKQQLTEYQLKKCKRDLERAAPMVIGNPKGYVSDAQRRKLHAMLERGEISAADVRKMDRESRGRKLPERKNIFGFNKPKSQGLFSVNFYTQDGKIKNIRRGVRVSGDTSGEVQRKLQGAYGNITITAIKRLKNNGTSDFRSFQKKRLTDLAKMFQGSANGDNKRVIQSDLAPRDGYRLGYLVLMKYKPNGSRENGVIEFDGEAYLKGDLRNNLWPVGKDSRIKNIPLPKRGQLKELGKLTQIDYVTAKKHIEDGKTVRFWHPLGEIDKEYPTLYVDADGFPIIIGGGYDVWQVGIVN